MHLAHTLLPAMIIPSLIIRLAASVVLSCTIKCVMHFPGTCLCSGLIHLVDMRSSAASPELHSIFLFSASTSGLWEVGTYSTMTDMAFSFMTDIAPYHSM